MTNKETQKDVEELGIIIGRVISGRKFLIEQEIIEIQRDSIKIAKSIINHGYSRTQPIPDVSVEEIKKILDEEHYHIINRKLAQAICSKFASVPVNTDKASIEEDK